MDNLRSFIDGRLSTEKEDEFLKKIVQFQIDTEKRNQWAQRLAQQHGINRNPGNPSIKNNIRRLLLTGASVAAVLLIGMLIVFKPDMLNGPSSDKLAMQYLENTKIPYSVAKKGTEKELLQLRAQLADAYNLSQYDKVLALSQKIQQEDQLTAKDQLFTGLSHLFLQDMQTGIRFLTMAREQQGQGENLEQETNWYLGLAYLATKQPDLAKNFLTQIKPGDWHYREAQQLLKKLN